jgi:putative SOS response-associated peptidase YedK
MCGRYVQTRRAREAAEFLTRRKGVLAPRPETWNMAPSTLSLAVRSKEATEEAWLSWGFRNAATSAISPINARIETAASKPLFREAWMARRCIVPVDGWYEWRLEAGKKQPYYFRRRDDKPMWFAGLWSGLTFCLLTTAADGHLAEIHHRRPLALFEDQAASWMGGEPPPRDQIPIMSLPTSEIAFQPVGSKVSSPRNDGPELIEEERLAQPEPEPELFANPS